MSTPSPAAANRRLLRRLLLAVVAMFGFGFALVPLYDVFCDITGLNGKTASQPVAVTSSAVDAGRAVTVEFLASVNGAGPWAFRPETVKMRVTPGQLYRTSYQASNLASVPAVGQAVPSVAPGLAARHLQKVECFCFARQVFDAGETRDMPVVFRLDPELPAEISTITLSYTFFEIEDGDG